MGDGSAGSLFAESDFLPGWFGQAGLARIVAGPTTTYSAIGLLTGAVGRVDGLAYDGDPAPAVPEPSSFVLALGLGGLGLAFGRRRQPLV